jgi:protein-tyrosine-phosphatase
LLANEWFDPAITVTSCGVGKDAGKGSTAKKTRDSLLRKFELKVNPILSTKASDELFYRSDIIFYMDNANLKRLTANFPPHTKKFVSLGSLIGLSRIDDPGFISDPVKVDEVISQVGKAVWKFKKTGYPSPSKLLSSVTINVTPPKMTEKKPKKEKPLMAGYLPITKFGRQLLESNDLDPIYCMLVDAKLIPVTTTLGLPLSAQRKKRRSIRDCSKVTTRSGLEDQSAATSVATLLNTSSPSLKIPILTQAMQ